MIHRVYRSKFAKFCVLFFVFFVWCQTVIASNYSRLLMVIAPRNFRDEELLVPMKIFEDNGYKVTIASLKKDICIGMLGSRVKPNITLKEVNPRDYVGIILVGGVGSQVFFNNRLIWKLVEDFYKQGKVVAAICLAPVVLANAGILRGKKATVWYSEAGQIEAKGAEYIRKNVVEDGRIVTGAGPFAAKEFAYKVLEVLKSRILTK